MEAIVLKRVGGLYQVMDADNRRYPARSRGKNKESGVMIGDRVEVELQAEGAVINAVLARRNSLQRPLLANVDQVVLVFAISQPPLHRELLDKMLIQAQLNQVEPLIVLQKIDQTPQEAQQIGSAYQLAGYRVLYTSARTGEGIEELRRELAGRISVFSGPSGVGKSSLLNAIEPEWQLAVGGLSQKISRGKHTTRHAELYGDRQRGFLADTPGFYHFDLPLIAPAELAAYFPEMREAQGHCRFADCLHDKEPGCAVKERLEQGKISPLRYEAYCQLLAEMKEREKGMYS